MLRLYTLQYRPGDGGTGVDRQSGPHIFQVAGHLRGFEHRLGNALFRIGDGVFGIRDQREFGAFFPGQKLGNVIHADLLVHAKDQHHIIF